MSRKIPHTFSDRVLDFRFPTAWQQLNQEQLRYVFFAITLFAPAKAKTYIFMRFTGIRMKKKVKGGWLCTFRISWRKKLRFIMHDWQICSFIRQLDFISKPNGYPVRLDCIAGRYAIDAMLHGLSFEEYLCCENHYQGYLYSQDINHLKSLYGFLYKKHPGLKGTLKAFFSRTKEYELMSVFLWWGSIKLYFSSMFHHFFQPIQSMGDTDQPEIPDLMGAMNAQIRALTGGDVTKEKEVLQMDCWRALTELDAKVHDIQELKLRQKNGRN